MYHSDHRDRFVLLRDFLAGSLAVESFHHRHHVQVAWELLEAIGLERATRLFPLGLRRLAERHGKPERFHATITLAYLFLIDERRRARGSGSWEAFAAANVDLLSWQPSILERYYTPERLWSDDARRAFVLPDRRAA